LTKNGPRKPTTSGAPDSFHRSHRTKPAGHGRAPPASRRVVLLALTKKTKRSTRNHGRDMGVVP
jgi:hypothetical protein